PLDAVVHRRTTASRGRNALLALRRTYRLGIIARKASASPLPLNTQDTARVAVSRAETVTQCDVGET
ncbi:hypothetical protein AB0E55_40020, partial [Amycolatopsis keratiniphila]|uniref:hypothetical protein n=1 Tax=Amycolatopsis keratiniphila TaxID=129921 RepID=UPI0033E18194